jgi:chemotaxis protein methyltransferase CheR
MSRPSSTKLAALPAEPGAAIRRLIDERYGFRPAPHAARTFTAALQTALAETGAASLEQLHDLLLTPAGAPALDTLAGSLTIGETHFFRVAPQVRMLREVVIPELVASRARQRRLSVWSAGCATGEEAYTLALLLREQLPDPTTWDVRIVATDVNRAALQAAQAGLYHRWSFRGTPPEIRERYFTAEDDQWRLTPAVRDMVRFAHLNLAAPAASLRRAVGARLDLIVCRNVTIYLVAAVTRELYRSFGELLAPDGWLVLGPADPTPGEGSGLAPVSHRGAVLWRRAPAVAPSARPSTTGRADTRQRPSAPTRRGPPPAAGEAASPRLAVPGPGSPRPGGSSASASPAGAPPSPQGADLDAARALLRAGERAAGRAAAERLAVERPLDPAAQLFLGMIHLEEGSVDAALAALRRATFLAPNDPLAQFSLGRAHARGGDADRARAALLQARRALAHAPDAIDLSTGDVLQLAELRTAVEGQLRNLEARAVD